MIFFISIMYQNARWHKTICMYANSINEKFMSFFNKTNLQYKSKYTGELDDFSAHLVFVGLKK